MGGSTRHGRPPPPGTLASWLLSAFRMARYSYSTLIRPCAHSDRAARTRRIHSFNLLSLTLPLS
jgi:hypothetical protein